MTLYEQETTINFTAADKTVSMFTADPVWIRKMDKLCERQPDVFKCTQVSMSYGEVMGKFYEFPKKLLSIRTKREYTEEEREKMREHMQKIRAKKNAEEE